MISIPGHNGWIALEVGKIYRFEYSFGAASSWLLLPNGTRKLIKNNSIFMFLGFFDHRNPGLKKCKILLKEEGICHANFGTFYRPSIIEL